MKWIKSFSESSKYKEKERTDYAYKLKKKLLQFNLNWQELIFFLEDNGFDTSKLEELNVPSNSFLNKGSFGMVFSYGNDKVIKVSFNKFDYDFARKLIGKDNEHLPNVYDIKSISNNVLTMFIIVMEKCKPLPQSIKTYINIEYKNIGEFFRTQDPEYLIPTEEEDLETYRKYDLGNQFLSMMEEIRELFGLNKDLDIHSANFMMKENNLCFIDIFVPKYLTKLELSKRKSKTK